MLVPSLSAKQQLGLEQDKAGSQELLLNLPCGWQGPKPLVILAAFQVLGAGSEEEEQGLEPECRYRRPATQGRLNHSTCVPLGGALLG